MCGCNYSLSARSACAGPSIPPMVLLPSPASL